MEPLSTGMPADHFEAHAGVLAGLNEHSLDSFVERLDALRNASEPSDGAAAGVGM